MYHVINLQVHYLFFRTTSQFHLADKLFHVFITQAAKLYLHVYTIIFSWFFLDEKVKAFSVSLNGQRDLWYLSISEMWSGQCFSVDTGDEGMLEQAAQNVLLMEAYART